MSYTSILRSADGNPEFTRVLGAFGTLAFTLVGCGLEIFVVWWRGEPFDVTAFCLAFPAGLATLVGGSATAAAFKDRKSADTKIVTETGAVPTAPPAGPPVPVDAVTDDLSGAPAGMR